MGESPIRILLADQYALFREALRTGLESESDLPRSRVIRPGGALSPTVRGTVVAVCDPR